jgi:hypothetical protein
MSPEESIMNLRKPIVFVAFFFVMSGSQFLGSAFAESLAQVPKDVKKYVLLEKLDAKALQAFANTSKENNKLVQEYRVWLKQNGKPVPMLRFSFSCPGVEQIKAATEATRPAWLPQGIPEIALLIGSTIWAGLQDSGTKVDDFSGVIFSENHHDGLETARIICTYLPKKKRLGEVPREENIAIFRAIPDLRFDTIDIKGCKVQDEKLEHLISISERDVFLSASQLKRGTIDLKNPLVFVCPYK